MIQKKYLNLNQNPTNQMVHYLLVKMTNEIIFYFVNKKDHLSRIRQKHDLENK